MQRLYRVRSSLTGSSFFRYENCLACSETLALLSAARPVQRFTRSIWGRHLDVGSTPVPSQSILVIGFIKRSNGTRMKKWP